MDMEEVFGNPIFSYTRRQAIDDGVLIQLSGPGYAGEEWIPQMVREVGITVPVAITSEACPVQIAGTVDGAHLFFRARSGEWRCAIDPEQDTARRAGRFLPAEAARYCAEGDDPDNGRMPHAAAWQIVREAVEAFRAGAVTR